MQPWKKKKSLMRGPKITAVFEPMEREVLGDLTATVSEAIIGRAQSAPKDELAEMLDMPTGHTEAPEDPSLARLFPDFEMPGDEEYEGDASLLRSLHENDIARAKIENLQVIGSAVGPTGGVEVTISEQEAQAFVAGLNDLRLYVAAGDVSDENLMLDRDSLVEWLAFCQDSLLQVLMD
ncbi:MULTISPECIES: DUF2017 domain-containing protein [Corynebacterium]|uniref:DUF2017 domain-containing protein n=1 Tax=Corynebacterium tuberculostearicum TaxID=38304 RepID=A0AAE4NKR8_9CORY|nr:MULTISPECIES: DUF2017 domain-containing protein [Corynebacterium]MCT1428807.1 DUF2017 domain-containing protein [Corynebacterium sp. p3-SID1241]MDV2418650.1 DUF2017 domain-containing protein [Corynebacterium tuberculostearicum]MDV2433664.1 DUF2017 domain-containing protein [Corynebacterium tuberculostearicum]WKE57333.1 DUF2017 domain-containing protein [Corynebacterium tuberculostearicum]WKE58836.1 DUF2017 domain-containing protein [Corynebacterium tuberculostearicum]